MPSLLEHFRGEEIIADHFDTENRAFVGALFFVWAVAGATGNGRNWGGICGKKVHAETEINILWYTSTAAL